MAQSFQQKARTRKLIYLGLIVGLFTVSILHRQLVIEPQAYRLNLRAQTKGKVELTSAAVRLAMFGSRGLASAVMWNMAQESQKRHKWNELEMLVRSIVTLQPNFVTPWIFQSWNLSFNVAVECDRTQDKYFYISRGIQLLAEGERRHQGTLPGESPLQDASPGNPDMRYYIAIYYLRKIGLPDERNAMRSLFELSCIDPLKRDSKRFWTTDANGRPIVDLKAFREFCRRHPRLVRRLKRKLRCRTPRHVLEYLDRNKGIPSRFNEFNKDLVEMRTALLGAEQQFPVLPPRNRVIEGKPELVPDRNEVDLDREMESFDVFVASRAWYAYSHEPLPPLVTPPLLGVGEPSVDLRRHRMPRMSPYLFRSFACRAQEYIAENLEEEGWFDEDGWKIRDWFDNPAGQTTDETVTVGRERKYHSRWAWDRAFQIYDEFGYTHGVLLPPEREAELRRKEKSYREIQMLDPIKRPSKAKLEKMVAQDPKLKESADAYERLLNQSLMLHLTNFHEHHGQCNVERQPEVVAIRKLFFQAEERENRAETPLAIVDYRNAFSKWLLILLREKEFRNIHNIQTKTCELEQQYLALLEDQFQNNIDDPQMFVIGLSTFGNIYAVNAPTVASLPSLAFSKASRRRIFPQRQVTGPLDWIYTYKVSKRQELQNFLLCLTQIPQPVPFAFSTWQRDWMLTLHSHKWREELNSQIWEPLIPTQIIRQTRSEVQSFRLSYK